MQRANFALMSIIFCFITSCVAIKSEEQKFYNKNKTQQQIISAFSKLNLDTKWKVYLYGMRNDNISPYYLAPEIANHGEYALNYVLGKPIGALSDFDYSSSSIVFYAIQDGKTYDICSNDTYIKKIKTIAIHMKNEIWRESYSSTISDMCAP